MYIRRWMTIALFRIVYFELEWIKARRIHQDYRPENIYSWCVLCSISAFPRQCIMFAAGEFVAIVTLYKIHTRRRRHGAYIQPRTRSNQVSAGVICRQRRRRSRLRVYIGKILPAALPSPVSSFIMHWVIRLWFSVSFLHHTLSHRLSRWTLRLEPRFTGHCHLMVINCPIKRRRNRTAGS